MINMTYQQMAIVIALIFSAMTIIIRYFPAKQMDSKMQDWMDKQQKWMDKQQKWMDGMKDVVSSQQDVSKAQHLTLEAIGADIKSTHSLTHDIRLDIAKLNPQH